MHFRYFLFGYLLIFCGFDSIAQSSDVYPEIGKPCPDFEVHNVKYYPRAKVGLADFKGKWLILDFWNKNCGACVSSFPYEDKLQKVLGNKVAVMMVGIQDKENQIEHMYDRFRKAEELNIPSGFNSVLAKKWDIFISPYIVIVDPDGRVQAITIGISIEEMSDLMEGKKVMLPKAHREHEQDNKLPFNVSKAFLVDNNGGVDSAFLYRSVLAVFDPSTQPYFCPNLINAGISNGRLQVFGALVENLYNYAYYGKFLPDDGFNDRAMFEIGDSLVVGTPKEYKNRTFSYSLSVPLEIASTKKFETVMRRDLCNYFGYQGNIEERTFKAWKLIVVDSSAAERMKTKGGKQQFTYIIPKADFRVSNYPFSRFLKLLADNHYNIIDCTGIHENVDLEMDCILSDIEEVRTALKRNGLGLEPAEVTKKVLALRKAE